MRRSALPLALAAALASAAVLTPAAAQAKTTKCSQHYTIFRSLTVSGTSCSQGLKVMKAFAKSGGAKKVLGYQVTFTSKGETSDGASAQYVTARKGAKVVKFVGLP